MAQTREAIAWSPAATVGDIAVANSLLTGELAAGLVDCRLSAAGKFRNGAARSWCVSHQTYWGVNADLARADGRCRAAHVPLAIVLDPLTMHIEETGALALTPDGGIHVAHLDVTVPALALLVPGVFAHPAIARLHITPPVLAAMAQADGCVDCARCGHPHLDLGSFAVRAHKRHTCGHCGHDSTHSGGAIVSNPLYRLRDKIALKV